MGDVLNWAMPIEWDDGTACELDTTEFRRVREGEALSAYFVKGHHEPRGWNRSTMPKISMLKPLMVNPDGSLDCARGPGAPRVVNTQMPMLRFDDGSEPVAGEILNDGTALRLWHADGNSHFYSWPTLSSRNSARKLVEITAAMVEAEDRAAEEAAEMQANPLFGMF